MNERKLYACDKCNSKMPGTGLCWHCHMGHGVQIYPVPEHSGIATVSLRFTSRKRRKAMDSTREYER